MRGTFFLARQGDMGAGRAAASSADQGPRNRSDPPTGGHLRIRRGAMQNACVIPTKATILTITERFERLALRAHEWNAVRDVRPRLACNKSGGQT